MTIKSTIEPIPKLTRFSNGIIASIPLNAFCKKSRPKNNNQNPAITLPEVRSVLFLNIFIAIPIPIIGSAKAEIFIPPPVPKRAIIHGIAVDPTLAPNKSQREFAKVKIPVFTKPIARSVVAVDDCNAVVEINHEIKPLSRVLVYFSKNLTRAGPDAALSPSVISDIPRRNSQIPPKKSP